MPEPKDDSGEWAKEQTNKNKNKYTIKTESKNIREAGIRGTQGRGWEGASNENGEKSRRECIVEPRKGEW